MVSKDELVNYLHGHCTDEESATIEQWLLEDPKHVEQLENILTDVSTVEVDRAAVRRRVMDTVATSSGTSRQGRLVPMRTVWRVAASIAFLLAFAFMVHKIGVWTAGDAGLRQIAAGSSGNLSTWLEDSSQIVLHAGSVLQVPTHFERTEREVILSGEAFFAVRRDEERPFTIRAGDARVEVLGTSFNIRSYDREEFVVVTVASGTVRVSRSEGGGAVAGVVLTKGHQAIVYKADGRIVRDSVDQEEFTSWKDGYVRYRNQTLEHILQGLERTYGVRIQADHTVDLSQRITLNQKATDIKAIFEVVSPLATIEYTSGNDSTIYVRAARRGQ